MRDLAVAHDEYLFNRGECAGRRNAPIERTHRKEALHELRLRDPPEKFCGERIIEHVGDGACGYVGTEFDYRLMVKRPKNSAGVVEFVSRGMNAGVSSDRLIVNVHQLAIGDLRRVLSLVLAASRSSHRGDFGRMGKGPCKLAREVFGAAWRKVQASAGVSDDFFHGSQFRAYHRGPTGQGFGNGHGKAFVPFAGQDQKT